MRTFKLGIFSDTHTGHHAGLHLSQKFQRGIKIREQEIFADWFKEFVEKEKPFDTVVFNGDMINGMGVKNSSECTMNINDQEDAAVEIVEFIDCKDCWFLEGTDVHVATRREGYQSEHNIAKRINGGETPKIFKHLQLKDPTGNWTLDFRHAPGSKAQAKVSMALPVIKEYMANIDWWMEGYQNLATHIFRGHLHKSIRFEEPNRWGGYLVPALQKPDTRYGKTLSNKVVVGFGILLIPENGDWPEWKVIEPPKPEPRSFNLHFPS